LISQYPPGASGSSFPQPFFPGISQVESFLLDTGAIASDDGRLDVAIYPLREKHDMPACLLHARKMSDWLFRAGASEMNEEVHYD
jgi:hypothetical protein